ncbi:MAG: PEP-utilizing enzyme, partial [Ilumatobacteraceae bacterium]
MNADAGLRWDKPGPGTWLFDGAHNVGPVTPIVQDVFPPAMADGFRSFTGRYGLAISHIDVRYVNGFAYGAMRIAGVPVSDRPPPPAWLMRVLTRVHPVFRARDRHARAALEQRIWHHDLRRWFDELRPARLAAVRALQSIDPTVLADDDLAAHVSSCVDGLAAGLREHFSLVGAASLPIGLYLEREAERGRSATDALADLTGAAADSTAATLPALAAIADALAAVGVDPVSLDDVRRASRAAAVALDAYLDEYGQRVIGAFDVTGRRLVELPDVVLRSIAVSRRRPGPAPSPPTASDTLAADARLAIASRDDHSGICCMWPVGLTRRALLAAGARLKEAGLLDHSDHVLDATATEVVALLRRRSDAPGARVLARRATIRHRMSDVMPPRVLGEQHAPPDPSVFPSGLRRTTEAMGAFLGAMEGRPGAERGVGVGVGRTVQRGRAVVAVDPGDAVARVEPGDVLVTTTTTPAFNCVLPIAGALVTSHGGPMSHAGIAARELGIPAVLGVADALEWIHDGAIVDVDPVAATVRLAPAHIAFGAGVRSPSVDPGHVGGKAAGLIEMAALGLPVPAGVVLPASLRWSATGPAIGEAVRIAVRELEQLTGRRLGHPERPLLVSVRSGAAVSMPGMMDTVLDVGMTPDIADALARSTGDAVFAEDTHRRFLLGYATTVGGLADGDVRTLVDGDASATVLVSRLAELGCVIPTDPIEQVIRATIAVHRSWDGERARSFRRREGIDDTLGTGVTIQEMVFGNLGPDSGSGVVFSRDPSTGAPGPVGDVLVGAQGDDVVDGGRQTLPLAALAERWPDVHAELVTAVDTLERHHADLVDVEFTVQEGRLHLLQCRRGRRSPTAALRIAVDMAEDPHVPVDRAMAVSRCRDLLSAPPAQLGPLPDELVAEHLIVTGLPAGPGRGVGVLVVSIDDALRRHDAGEPVVLVRAETSPADVAAMSVARGLVTASGGLVSHAAVVARSWGIPAVVGAAGLAIDTAGVIGGGRRVDVGEVVTVDGTTGTMLIGAHPGRSTEPRELDVLRRWAADVDRVADAHPAPGGSECESVRDWSDLDLVRLLVLRGRAGLDGLAAALGATSDAVDATVTRLDRLGHVEVRGTVVTTAPAGRDLVAADVAAV